MPTASPRAQRTDHVDATVPGRRRRRRWMAPAAVAGLAALLAGCGAAGKNLAKSAPAAGSGTLTVAFSSPPNSLNPALINQAFEWYVNLAYDPLIVWGPKGTAQPGLATSWSYVGSGNKVLKLKLRSGVHFSDGSALTAKVVKANLDYEKKAGGQAAPFWADKTVAVTGPLTLTISSSQPDPQMVRELTQDYLAGNIISAKALSHPKRLGTTTDGAGPYELQASKTVSGDTYVYTPNPHYYNPSAVHYQKITIKVIANPNSVLDALKTGQVDAASSDYTIASTAQSAGLTVTDAPLVFMGLNLMDRSGTTLHALGDVRVRRAINYALDRKTISKALFGKFGTPTEQTVVPGQDGSLSKPVYSYDPKKAKALLASAGQAKGLTIPVVTTPFAGQSKVTQAIAGELEAVGIHLKLTTVPTQTQQVGDMTSHKFPVSSIGFGGLPIYLEGPSLFLPSAATFNPFATKDAVIASLYAKASAAPPSARAKLDEQIERRLVTQAWFAPVTLSPVFYYSRSDVSGVSPSAGQPITDPVWWHPAG